MHVPVSRQQVILQLCLREEATDAFGSKPRLPSNMHSRHGPRRRFYAQASHAICSLLLIVCSFVVESIVQKAK